MNIFHVPDELEPGKCHFTVLTNKTVEWSEIVWSSFTAYKLYSGNCLYFSNSKIHCSSVNGGVSLKGCQSTIERPDSVNRVTPPRTTAPNVIPDRPISHLPIEFWLSIVFITVAADLKRPEILGKEEPKPNLVDRQLLVSWTRKSVKAAFALCSISQRDQLDLKLLK